MKYTSHFNIVFRFILGQIHLIIMYVYVFRCMFFMSVNVDGFSCISMRDTTFHYVTCNDNKVIQSIQITYIETEWDALGMSQNTSFDNKHDIKKIEYL